MAKYYFKEGHRGIVVRTQAFSAEGCGSKPHGSHTGKLSPYTSTQQWRIKSAV